MTNKKRSFKERVWAGDKRTVAEARNRYLADPEDALIGLASVLYSFRYKKRYARELQGLEIEIIRKASEEIGPASVDSRFAKQEIAKLDMLATYLVWLSRRSPDPETCLEVASLIGKRGLELTVHAARMGIDVVHSHCLIELTMAQIAILRGDIVEAGRRLDCPFRNVIRITDSNQKARVYRKLGLLHRKIGRRRIGFECGFRAFSGVPFAVKVKSFAALLGIER